MRVFISFLLSASLVFGQEAATGPVVSTHYGQVQGGTGEARDGRMYYSFRGIPYGKAPARFQAPEVPDNWEGVKTATEAAPPCIQYCGKKKELFGIEDCLNLDVYTPRLPKEGQDKVLLPVVVYIHPGLNNKGSNEGYQPQYFMQEDVILVIPNFRLGLFGFLSTHDKQAQGNMGLRDQVQALRWIKENIEKFGGDKDRVTILGSGSGGADAFIHTISPQSKGLLNGVISMGGATLSRMTFILNPVKQAKKLGTQIGCPIDSSEALVTCLKNKEAKEIFEKMVHLDKMKLNVEEKAWFGPTVDKLIEGQTEDDLIIPDNPVKLLKDGKIVNKVPVILGGNEHEGVNPLTAYFLKNETLFERLDKKFNEIAPIAFIYKDTALDKDAVTSKIREYYFGDKAINRETFMNLTNLFMDRFMGFGLVITAKLYSKHAPVYLYYFSHKPQTTGLSFFGIEENLGMGHLDDIQYLFKINSTKFPYPEITKDHAEYDLSKNLVKLLGSFAETGKPTKTYGEGKVWEKIDDGNPNKWYKLGLQTELRNPPPEHLAKRVEFWKGLYSEQLAKEKETPIVEPF
jgi:bile salt-stimulated lipase